MKFFYTLCAFFILLASQAQYEFKSLEHNFKANFQSKPDYKLADVDFENMTLPMHVFTHSDSNLIYMILKTNYPSNYFQNMDLDTFIFNAGKSFFEEMGMPTETYKNVKCKKYKGMEFASLGKEFGVFYRIFNVKDDIFQLIIMQRNSLPLEKTKNTFFNSFKILK